MKVLIAAILLATTALSANAEPRTRQVKFVCATLEELEITMEKYGEKMVIATQSPNERTVNILYANFETQTTSWILHDLQTDEYCMVGVGKDIYIPDASTIKEKTELETKIIYK